MAEWKIEKAQKRCQGCSKQFEERESYYSAIVEREEKFARNDLCRTCWESNEKRGDPFSYWVSVVPVREERSREDINAVVDFFKRLSSEELDDTKRKILYLVSLILLRKRRLKLLGTVEAEAVQTMRLEKVWSGEEVAVFVPRIGEAELDQIKAEMEQLFDMEFNRG